MPFREILCKVSEITIQTNQNANRTEPRRYPPNISIFTRMLSSATTDMQPTFK